LKNFTKKKKKIKNGVIFGGFLAPELRKKKSHHISIFGFHFRQILSFFLSQKKFVHVIQNKLGKFSPKKIIKKMLEFFLFN
jgi:hypothetical protein